MVLEFMGRGIAQVAATAGFRVLVYDYLEPISNDALNLLGKCLIDRLEKGKIDEKIFNDALNKLIKVDNISDFRANYLIILAHYADFSTTYLASFLCMT